MIDMVQGSPEWLLWREGGLGSTAAATIMGLNPYMTAERLFLEKTKQVEPEDISKKYAVKRGSALEPHARKLFNTMSGANFKPKTFVDSLNPELRYSSDGFDEKTGDIIEIKCMGERNHQKVLDTNQAIDYYIPQCLWGMMVSGSKRCWFISYNPRHQEPILIVEIKPDPIFTKEMRTTALAFWQRVLEYKKSHSVLDLNTVSFK